MPMSVLRYVVLIGGQHPEVLFFCDDSPWMTSGETSCARVGDIYRYNLNVVN